MIVLICEWEETDRGREFLVSHGFDEYDNMVFFSPSRPEDLGAIYDPKLQEWIIYED